MRYPKRSQYRYAKSRYRVWNWAEYEAGLRSRGDLTIWLADDALDAWQAVPSGRICNTHPTAPSRAQVLQHTLVGVRTSMTLG